MTLRLTSQQNAAFDVSLPDGTQLPDAANIAYWEGFLPLGGDYLIDVKAAQASEFTLEIQVDYEL